MKIQHYLISILLGFSLSGCSAFWCPDPETITEYRYIKRPLPELENKPKADKYDMFQIQFNGVDYFAISKVDAAVMSSNWSSYREWSETNYQHLINLRDADNNVTAESSNLK